MDLLDKTRHNIVSRQLFACGERVVVAVSGGPDSLCLLHVLAHLRAELGIELHVAHLNHGLRGEDADADADFVRGLAAEWGIGATVESADVRAFRAEHRLSLEEAARQVRYTFLSRVAAEVAAQAIAVGHTADDQVETILMHLLRGAGLTGLRGMLHTQMMPGGMRLVRPLLETSRSEVAAYCAAHDLHPRHDQSNEDVHIWRNRLRRQALPILEQASPNLRRVLLRTARILADEDAYLGQVVRTLWPQIADVQDGVVSINLAMWRAQPAALQRRIAREAWHTLTSASDDLAWVHVEAVRDLLLSPAPGRRVSLPGGVLVQASYAFAYVYRAEVSTNLPADAPLLPVESIRLSVPGVTHVPESGWVVETSLGAGAAAAPSTRARLSEQFDADVVGHDLVLRRWRRGERMQPLGMAGSRKLHDIMVDSRAPRHVRSSLAVLATPEHILWLVGLRRSDWGKITPRTRQVLCVTFNRDASAGHRQTGEKPV